VTALIASWLVIVVSLVVAIEAIASALKPPAPAPIEVDEDRLDEIGLAREETIP
jgi:hypothetical protein